MTCCGQKSRLHSQEVLTSNQIILRDTKPKAEPDGSLVFEGLAPVIKGYIHDPMDMRRLKVDNAPCTERISMPLLNQNGTYTLFNQCNHFDCDKRGQTVDEEICKECPLRKVPRNPNNKEE